MACGWDGRRSLVWNFYKLILTSMPGEKQAGNYFTAIKHFLICCIYVNRELIKISGKTNSCFYNCISFIFPSGYCLTIFGSWSLEIVLFFGGLFLLSVMCICEYLCVGICT